MKNVFIPNWYDDCLKTMMINKEKLLNIPNFVANRTIFKLEALYGCVDH